MKEGREKGGTGYKRGGFLEHAARGGEVGDVSKFLKMPKDRRE